MAVRRGDWLSIFIAASIVAHLLGAAAVTFIPSLHELVFGAPKAREARAISGDKLRPLAANRLRLGAANIRQESAVVETIAREMDGLSAPQVRRVGETRGDSFLKDLKDELRSIAKEVSSPKNKGPWPNSDEGLLDAWQKLKETEAKVVNSYQLLRATRLVARDETLRNTVLTAKVECPDRREPDAVALTRDFVDSLDPNIDKFRKEIEMLEGDARVVTAFARKLMDIALAAEKMEQEGLAIVADSAASVKSSYNALSLTPDFVFDGEHQKAPMGMVPCNRIVTEKGYKPGANGAMFVGDWYTIGPFDNARRRSLNTRFLPEVGVDLDAVYTGKNGKGVSWKWIRSQNPIIKPEFGTSDAIWYYFTEIYLDQASDIWVALGSDDYGKLWVNDKLVWVSATESKPYNWRETIMPVPFKKGYNKIMFRLENAAGLTAFSVILVLQ